MVTLYRTTRIAFCCSAAVLAGCAKKENAAIDTSGAMASSTASTTSAAAPGTVNLADVAGKWNMKAVPMSGDTTPTRYVLTATSNTDGWTITFPGRAAIPTKVTVDGDSIMLSAGPYSSVRRKGVQVTTYTVARVQSGRLNGTTTAHYKVKSADSVLVLTTSGDRAK
ncbi:MAG TPA: hypothetical protein VJV97_03440 [Gemmatimonadaceae bacterium]|nr:hypothetical protein [Gemmatimonadaceae bacterium]